MIDLNATSGEIVSVENIRSKVSDMEIIRFYVGDVKIGDTICSPLRKDNLPSFAVFYSQYHQKPMFKDHATGNFGDAFDLVKQMYRLPGLYQACGRINEDMKLGFSCPEAKEINSTPVLITPKNRIRLPNNKKLGVKFRRWSQEDYNYWTIRYGVTEQQASFFGIFPVKSVFLGPTIIWEHSKDNPIYTYLFHKDGEYTYKIYRPLNPEKRFKWMSNTNVSVLQGWDQLPSKGELLILTKSLKDALIYRTLGFYALSCQNELGLIKDSVMEDLRNRFKRIVVQQDFDYAGVRGTNVIRKKYNLPYFFIQDFKTRSNGFKDISDYREWHSAEKTKLLISNKLRKIWPGLY